MTAAQAPSTRGESAVERRPLASVVREETPLGTELAADIAFDVCDALASLHANGIVHGDLGLNRIRLAWPRGEDRGIEIFAREDETVGRPSGFYTAPARFAAPEQRRSGAMIDTRADIWAVGALLRVLLGGKPRPQTLTDLVDACLAEDPAQRPQTIREVAERLATFSSWPPACFERIAARKQADDDAKSALARREAQDGLGALERLEQRAIDREREGLRTPLPGPLAQNLVLDRLVSVVVEQTGSAPPDVAAPAVIDIADDDLSVTLDDQEDLDVAVAVDDDYDDLLPTIAHPSSAPDVYVAEKTDPTPPVIETERVPPVQTMPMPRVSQPSIAAQPSVVVSAPSIVPVARASRPSIRGAHAAQPSIVPAVQPSMPEPRASQPSIPGAHASQPSIPGAHASQPSIVSALRASQPAIPTARASSPSLPFTPRGSSPSVRVAAPTGSWPRVATSAMAPSSSPYVAPLSVSHPPSSRTAALLAPPSSSAQLPAAPVSDRELDTVRRRKRARAAVPWILAGAFAMAISAVGVFTAWTYFAHRASAATETAFTPAATATTTTTATEAAITPASLPDVHITPAALPDAPIHRAAPAPVARKPAPAATDDDTTDAPKADAPKPAPEPKAKADAPKKPATKDDEFE